MRRWIAIEACSQKLSIAEVRRDAVVTSGVPAVPCNSRQWHPMPRYLPPGPRFPCFPVLLVMPGGVTVRYSLGQTLLKVHLNWQLSIF